MRFIQITQESNDFMQASQSMLSEYPSMSFMKKIFGYSTSKSACFTFFRNYFYFS